MQAQIDNSVRDIYTNLARAAPSDAQVADVFMFCDASARLLPPNCTTCWPAGPRIVAVGEDTRLCVRTARHLADVLRPVRGGGLSPQTLPARPFGLRPLQLVTASAVRVADLRLLPGGVTTVELGQVVYGNASAMLWIAKPPSFDISISPR
jgi:hypothetical protein